MRAVLFDLGNTLVSYYAASDFAPILRDCLRACARAFEYGPDVDEEDLFQRAVGLNTERADHTVWPLIDRLNTLFDMGPQDAATERRIITAFMEPLFATAVADPEATRILASLRADGFATAIVSNTPWGSPAAPWRAELARHQLLTAVDAVVFCADVGYRKPHRAPFERALSLLGVRASDAVFVGDDPRWDVFGATQAGIQPLLLAPSGTQAAAHDVPVARNLTEVLDHMRVRASVLTS